MPVILGKFCPMPWILLEQEYYRNSCQMPRFLGNRPRDIRKHTGYLPGSVLGVNGSGQKEKLGCDAVSVKASSNPSRSSEAEVTVQDYFDLGREDQTFIMSLNVSFSGKETQIWATTLSSAKAIPIRKLTGNGYQKHS